jgi:hypothetical protein
LVLGATAGLATALQLRLAQSGIAADYGALGPDAQTSAALTREDWAAVVILTRDDVLALRLSLLR